MAHGTRRGRGWLLWVASIVVIAIVLPVAMAIAAPRLAPTPNGQSLLSPPPLPVPGPEASSSLSSLYSNLPVVVGGNVDAAAQRVSHEYAQARLRNPSAPARMFSTAWHSLTVSPANVVRLRVLEGRLISGQAGQSGAGPPTAGLGTAIGAIAPDLARDSANAGRLNDAAAAMYLLTWANLYGKPVKIIDGFRTPAPELGEFYYVNGAAALLAETVRIFPRTRAAAINLAYLHEDLAEPLLRGVLRRRPADVTARLLLSSLLARGNTPPSRPQAALTIIRPLLASPRLAALGNAAMGDIHLTQAFQLKDTARFTARSDARQALDDYDAALRLTTDPGVLSGRAGALDFLGFIDAAIAAQERAARLAPNAIGVWTRLSYLQEEAGNLSGMRASTQHALALERAGWNPLLSNLTFQLFPWTAREGSGGFLHLSYASAGDVFAIPPQGGGFLEILDGIPRTDTTVLATMRDTSTSGAAIQAALAADVLAGDPAAAIRDGSVWESHASLSAEGADIMQFPILVGAAQLVAGQQILNAGQSLALAQAILRDAGRFSAAYRLCRGLEASAALRASAPQCAGEAAFQLALTESDVARRLNDYRGAVAQLTQAYSAARRGASADLDRLRLETAAAATAAAQEEHAQQNQVLADADITLARRLLTEESRQTATNGNDILALSKLGDLAYQRGDIKAAITAYTATFDASKREYHGLPLDAPALLAEQIAYNNRGISLLILAQPGPQAEPDCARHAAVCSAAASDFARAESLDAADPVVLLNAGWVARLQGHEEEARSLLDSATLLDPTLYPAFNDLGVLNAESGNRDAARRDFAAALAANPGYDLAAWNLGVLDTRAGLGSAAEGQAYLARAIDRNRAFRSSELDYKTDERVYRYLVGADTPHGQALDRGYNVAAVALSWIALLGALLVVAKHVLTDFGQERLAEQWEERGPELREKFARRIRKILRRSEPAPKAPEGGEAREGSGKPRFHPWVLAFPALVAITVFLAWRSSPDAVLSVTTLTLFASLIALVTHEAGHRLIAAWAHARVSAAHWGSSIPLAALTAILPVEVNMGPFVGHHVESDASEHRHYLVYLAGPGANLLLAGVAYLFFLVHPVPFFRLLTAVQLTVCAYALLPVKPLDGGELEDHPRLLLAFSIVLLCATLALTLGVL